MQGICPIDFSDPDVQVCPFSAYDRLRAIAPVHIDPGTGFYVVLDLALLREIANDPVRFSNSTGLIQVRSGELGERMQAIQSEHGVEPESALLTTDPPEHGFFRSLVDKAFSQTRVRRLEEFLVDIVDEIIDEFIDRGAVEFVQEMAVMVPVHIVVILLGVSRDSVNDIKRWSDAASAGTDPALSDEAKLGSMAAVCEFQRFILNCANHYRGEPNDSLLSELANAQVDGRRLTDGELVSVAQQILVAGHETTASTIASGMLYLIETPGLEQRLRDNPKLVANFVEEILRLEAPLQGMFRKTMQDVVLAGVPVPRGSIIVMRWGAANRDPAVFADPGTLDLDRANRRHHLAFGAGPHFCVGNQLARAELRIAFERMLQRMKNFKLQGGPSNVTRMSHYFIYGITRMEVSFDKAI